MSDETVGNMTLGMLVTTVDRLKLKLDEADTHYPPADYFTGTEAEGRAVIQLCREVAALAELIEAQTNSGLALSFYGLV